MHTFTGSREWQETVRRPALELRQRPGTIRTHGSTPNRQQTYPVSVQRTSSLNRGVVPCQRMPVLKIRPARKTLQTVVANSNTSPVRTCHKGITDSEAKRSTMTMGVAGGKNDIHVAIDPFGSRTTCNHTNIGNEVQACCAVFRMGLYGLLCAPMLPLPSGRC